MRCRTESCPREVEGRACRVESPSTALALDFARAALGVALLLLAACAPKNLPRMRCTNELLALGDPWSCTLSADRLDGPSSPMFTTESSNLLAEVQLAFTVKEGALTLGWKEAGGPRTASVTPDAPLSLEVKVPLRKASRSFVLDLTPQPAVVGLEGTVTYKTP